MAKIKLREWKKQKKTQKIIDIVLKLVEKYDSLTVRQVHYLLVETPEANHPNTINSYQKVSRILKNMRYNGLLDWDLIVDETRNIYKTESYKDMVTAQKKLLKNYRRDRWKENDYYVEVWTEKRTLVRPFYQISVKYDVYLASGGGFSSTTYIYEAVDRLYRHKDKNIKILYFGDLDPSGDFMDEDIKKRFEEWGLDVEVKRISLNYEHLEVYNLKKRFDVEVKRGEKIYNKIKADPRAKGMYEKYREIFQVELEALDPNILNEMLKSSIVEYVDEKQQKEVKKEEEKEVKEIRKKLKLKEEKKNEN